MLFINYLTFIFFCLLVILPLGLFLSNQLNLKMSILEKISLSLNLGLVFIVAIIFILWRFNLYPITYLIFLFPVICSFFYFRQATSLRFRIEKFREITIPLITILAVLFISGLVTVPFGEDSKGGLALPNAHNFDTLSYIAITQSIKKSLPAKNLLYQGEVINNYNYLALVIPASLDYVFNIPPIISMFKIIPIFLLLLFCLSLYSLFLSLGVNKTLASFGVLSINLSSNLFYLVKLFYPNSYFSPSVMWVDEYATRLVNPQLLFSYSILVSLALILNKKENLKIKDILLVGILGGSLIAIKAFAGILFIATFGLITLWKIFKRKYDYLIGLMSISGISVIFYLLSNSETQASVFILSPMWFIKNIYETSDHLNYVIWELKRETYLKDHNWLRIIQLYIEGFMWFIVVNLGTRLIGLFSLRYRSKEGLIVWLLLIQGLLGVAIPLLVIVRGTAWNSIQFFYYSVIAFGLLSIIAIDQLLKARKRVGFLLAIFLWLPLIPGVLFTTTSYLNNNQQTVSKLVYDSLLFLKTRESGVVLVDPLYNKNALIPAISGQPAFFADEMMLNVQLINYQQRKNFVDRLFSQDLVNRSELIRQNNIKYIYTTSVNATKFTNFKKIYQNEQVVVYQVI